MWYNKKNADFATTEYIKTISETNLQIGHLTRTDKPLIYDNPHKFLTIQEPFEENEEPGIPTIQLKILNKKIIAIVDTAAEISLINENILSKIQEDKLKIVPVKKQNLVATNQKKIGEISKKMHVTPEIDGKEYLMEFFIFKGMNNDCLIGIDNLNMNNAKIDLENYMLTLGEENGITST
ncbi:hypothetical protein QE152_g22232 [Popillia japonica]|uniref:Uncharacterized protein n=1 Tax=Popillia japonica TaxID=7064 RepID=A0AAW1KJD4_POPJA